MFYSITIDLSASRQYLTMLRVAQNGGKLKTGPIVYGNGHHDGKKPRGRIKNTPLVISVRPVLQKALTKTPNGLTTAEMRVILSKAGITLPAGDTNLIHNALRKIPGITKSGKARSGPQTYSIKAGQNA